MAWRVFSMLSTNRSNPSEHQRLQLQRASQNLFTCETSKKYTNLFLGSVKWILLEIANTLKTIKQHVGHMVYEYLGVRKLWVKWVWVQNRPEAITNWRNGVRTEYLKRNVTVNEHWVDIRVPCTRWTESKAWKGGVIFIDYLEKRGDFQKNEIAYNGPIWRRRKRFFVEIIHKKYDI